MELDELRAPGQPPRVPLDVEDDDGRRLVRTVLAGSVLVAAGAAPAIPDLPPSPVDDDFLAAIRRRPALLTDETFEDQLYSGVARAIFPSPMQRSSVSEVIRKTEAVCRGLVAIGAGGPARAAARVRECTVGRGRPDGRLPNADVGEALAFLRAVDAAGAFGSMASADGGMAPAQMTHWRLEEAIRRYPSYDVPHRETWLQALQTFWTEKSMRDVLERGAAAAEKPAARPARARLCL
jgi:hypothetical protein